MDGVTRQAPWWWWGLRVLWEACYIVWNPSYPWPGLGTPSQLSYNEGSIGVPLARVESIVMYAIFSTTPLPWAECGIQVCIYWTLYLGFACKYSYIYVTPPPPKF